MNEAGPTRVRQELASIPKQSARRNSIAQANQPLSRILHLQHLRAPRTELLDHVPEERLGDVDHQLLVRLESFTVSTDARDHARPRHLKLIALASHRLH